MTASVTPNVTADAQDVMTVPEAAKLLRVNHKTVRAACAKGTLPHVRIGKLIRLSRTALLRWIETGRG